MSINQNTQAHFTQQSVNEAINQNVGLSGQSASQSVFGAMPEQVIAVDCLISSKAGIKTYARALTECSTPELRQAIKKHLDAAIAYHESVLNYMSSKGYDDSWDSSHLANWDIQLADNAIKLQS